MSAAPRVRVRDDQRGTALIEFALILPFLLVITLGIIDFSRAFYVKGMLTSAAREGARTAVELNDPATSGSADNLTVAGKATDVLAPVSNATFGVSGINVAVIQLGEQYEVTVSGQFRWLYLGALNHFSAGSFTNPETLRASAVFQRIG